MNNETRNRNRANKALQALTNNRYFDGLPVGQMVEILEEYSFDGEPLHGVYCGVRGHVHEQVGPKTWFSLS